MSQFDNARPPEMLEHRPEARAFKIEDLMLEIRRGRLRIPSFQRRLAWDREDARKLIDSLYRGYPVGTLLFWETAAQRDQMQWGGLRLGAEARPDALLVVDGQQRLVSLARVLLTTDDDEDDFALCFDLDRQDIVFPPLMARIAEDASRWLPLNRVLDSTRLLEWLYEHEPSRERRERALQFGKRIREYDLMAYVVRDGSEAMLGEMRRRMHAREGLPPRRHVAADMVGPGFLVGPVTRFIRRDAGVPHESLLPDKRVIETLEAFFRFHPHPRSRSRELLARWLWRDALHGGPVHAAAPDLIDPDDEEGSVQRLLDSVRGDRPAQPSASERFNIRQAGGRLQALALLSLQPRNLRTGEPISPGARPSFVTILKDRQIEDELAQSVANRLAHPARPGLPGELLQVTEEAVLASHGISAAAFAALQAGDGRRFLALRAATLNAGFERFFARHARWDASDRPSLASLVVSDDDEPDQP